MKKSLVYIFLTFSLFIFSQKKDSLNIEILNFSNNSSNDYSTTPYKDGIFFISDRLNNKQNLFYADLKNKPKKIKLKSKYHIGPICFDKNNDDVYLTLSNNTYTSHLSIYKGKIEDGKITNLNKLSFCHRKFDYGHPSILNNLMVISRSKNNEFSLIIYENIDDTWNIKNVIITEKRPLVFPFFKDDNTIIFSSKRKGGFGGLDIYKIENNNGVWSDPINLKEFNTIFDDFGLVCINETEGYFTSNRYNKDHIFKFTFNK